MFQWLQSTPPARSIYYGVDLITTFQVQNAASLYDIHRKLAHHALFVEYFYNFD